MSAPVRTLLRWQQTSTIEAEVTVDDNELCAWAIGHLGIRTAGGAASPSDIGRGIRANPHFRARLLQLYAIANDTTTETRQPTIGQPAPAHDEGPGGMQHPPGPGDHGPSPTATISYAYDGTNPPSQPRVQPG